MLHSFSSSTLQDVIRYAWDAAMPIALLAYTNMHWFSLERCFD